MISERISHGEEMCIERQSKFENTIKVLAVLKIPSFHIISLVHFGQQNSKCTDRAKALQ